MTEDLFEWLMILWPLLLPVVFSLVLIWSMISVVRKGYALSVIPLGLILLSGVLAFAGMFFNFADKEASSNGCLIAAGVSIVCMVVSVVPVNLHYHKQGKPVPTRRNYSPRFLIGWLIVCLVFMAFCFVMAKITSNNP